MLREIQPFGGVYISKEHRMTQARVTCILVRGIDASSRVGIVSMWFELQRGDIPVHL
jgi:hypothetical protein